MAKPEIDVESEPLESGAIVYGPLAARSKGAATNNQLSALFYITNNTDPPVEIRLTKVDVSFVGPPDVAPVSISADRKIAPGQKQYWYYASNLTVLPDPAPAEAIFSLTFENYSDPEIVSVTLAPYEHFGFNFPAKVADLNKGEYWGGLSAVHGPAGHGRQMFAYDLRVFAYETAEAWWETVIQGFDGTKNEHYRAWGKPIYAMADGEVDTFEYTIPDNTPPGIPQSYLKAEGNHFYVKHGDDVVCYAHLQLGSQPAALLVGGAPVAKGQFLGLAGNSGRSSEPHLHLHAMRMSQAGNTVGRPCFFNWTSVLDYAQVDTTVWPPNKDQPWNLVTRRALPSRFSAIWPSAIPVRPSPSLISRLAIWAWVIIIGGLMFTPGGIDCIRCGPLLDTILGVVTIAAGVAGLASELWRRNAAPSVADIAPRLQKDIDMHGATEL